MGPTHDNFIPWGQLHMLIIEQPDKMCRDLTNSKGSTELSVMSMWIVVSGENHNVSNLVFSLSKSECLANVRDTAMSLLHCFHSSHFKPRQPSPIDLSCHCLIQPAGGQFLHKSRSLSRLAWWTRSWRIWEAVTDWNVSANLKETH
jgi:hypothetical protein